MRFRFDFEKSLQAAGVVVGLGGSSMGYLRLLKLLYIADREMLAATGSPITGDRAVSMKHGPVLSHIDNLIKGQHERAGEWADCLKTTNYNVELSKPIGRGKLNRAEVEKLQEVFDRHRNDNVWDICDLTHEFPEWRDNYLPNTSQPIPWEEALVAQGKASIIPVAQSQADLRQTLDTLFGP